MNHLTLNNTTKRQEGAKGSPVPAPCLQQRHLWESRRNYCSCFQMQIWALRRTRQPKMQAERFRLARLASVGRQEEKLNNSIKAKLHTGDVFAAVGFYAVFFFHHWEHLHLFAWGFTLQNLNEEALGWCGNSTPSEAILLPGSGGGCQVCQEMMVGSGRSQHRGLVSEALSLRHREGLAAPNSCCCAMFHILLLFYAQCSTRSYFPYRLSSAADLLFKAFFFNAKQWWTWRAHILLQNFIQLP